MQPNNLPIVAIVVLIIGAAVYAAIQSNQPESCELFEGYSPTTTEKSRIFIALGKSNLNGYTIESGKIMVPHSQKPKYLAAIQDEQAVPQTLQKEKEATANPFLPKSQQAALALERKKRQIRDMIQRLPFVAEAWFEMDWAPSDSVYQPDQHSAVVMVTLNNAKALTRQQVTAIQGMVGGAIAKIDASQVVVTDANMGVSYRDLNDHSQSELIELVNWKMDRKIYYLERLQDLNEQYPGIQFDIEIQVDKTSSQPERLPRSAKNPPVKLAHFNEEMTLNGAGEVSAAQTVIAIPSRVEIQPHSQVQPAKHIVPSVATTLSSTRKTESLVIHVRVPIEYTLPIDNEQSASPDSRLKQVAQFKTRLAEEIRLKLAGNRGTAPKTKLVLSILDQHPRSADQIKTTIAEASQLYWPLCAVVVICIGTVLFSRRQTQQPLNVESTNTTDQELAPEQLQTQLTELIDQDPESAAKVIKNWIRDAG